MGELGPGAFESAAEYVLEKCLDHFPPFIGDRCLRGAHVAVGEYSHNRYRSGLRPDVQVLSMPRRSFGSRPVVLPDLASRVIYRATVEDLSSDLPSESRTDTNWRSFDQFAPASKPTISHIVEFDIAACYEYIDHSILFEQLLLASGRFESMEALRDLLGKMMERPVGLPQMVGESDRLADLYLEHIERALLRVGFDVVRYVDDFKVRAQSWSQANEILDHATTLARDLGLVLSAEKARIFKTATVKRERESWNAILQEYEPNDFDLLAGDYDEITSYEDGSEVWHRVLNDWASFDAKRKSGAPGPKLRLLDRLLSTALVSLAGDEDVDRAVLRQLIYRDPTRLEAVCRYLSVSSRDAGDRETTFEELRTSAARSPWSDLWLLDLLDKWGSNCPADALPWVESKLRDRLQVVRAEAAWVLAQHGRLTTENASELYIGSSDAGRAGIAAAIGRAGFKSASPIVAAVKREPSFIADAYNWGVSESPVRKKPKVKKPILVSSPVTSSAAYDDEEPF